MTTCSRSVLLGAKTLLLSHALHFKMELKMCVVHYWCWIRLICITETVLHYICGDTGTRVWMSDVDTAHQPVNVFKIAEDGFKVVQEKEMEEADKPQNAKMTDGLGKCSVFSLY